MSDILIRGMEMPRNCEECDVKVVCKNYWKLIREQYTRPSWCPLVPVPPHGRLGDLDALEKILKEKQAKYKARDLLATHELSEAMRMGFDAAVGHVLMAPTIIPAEGGDK